MGYGMENFGVLLAWGFCGDSHGFSVGMGWVWGLKSNPHGSPSYMYVRVSVCQSVFLLDSVPSSGWFAAAGGGH